LICYYCEFCYIGAFAIEWYQSLNVHIDFLVQLKLKKKDLETFITSFLDLIFFQKVEKFQNIIFSINLLNFNHFIIF
jgi:hypothetical protein